MYIVLLLYLFLVLFSCFFVLDSCFTVKPEISNYYYYYYYICYIREIIVKMYWQHAMNILVPEMGTTCIFESGLDTFSGSEAGSVFEFLEKIGIRIRIL